jgi:hypothetical protein
MKTSQASPARLDDLQHLQQILYHSRGFLVPRSDCCHILISRQGKHTWGIEPHPSISTSSLALSSTCPSCCSHAYHVDSSGRSSEVHFSLRYVFAIRSKNLCRGGRTLVRKLLHHKIQRALEERAPYGHVERARLEVRLRDTMGDK